MDRRSFLKTTASAATLGVLHATKAHGESMRRRGPKQPNLVFVMADQWRRHALGFMNEDPVLTPNFDAFSLESRVFTNATTCIPICSPYRASLLTGRYPISNTVVCNNLMLPTAEVTIADVMKEAGYATGYIGKWHLDGDPFNHFTPPGERRAGFDFWYANGCYHNHFELCYWRDDPEPITGAGWQPDHETDVAIDYIQNRDEEKPFALFISYAIPHTIHGGPKMFKPYERLQYAAPREFEDLYRGRNLPRRPNVENNFAVECLPGYFGAITSMDDNFGRLMKCLAEQGLDDNTIVVVTADHGEMMGSHGAMTKGIYFEESIGIPFLIRWPEHIKTGHDDMLFNSVDVMPSLLGLMDLPIPKQVEGSDFSRAMRGKRVTRPSSAYIQFFRGAPNEDPELRPWRGVRTERYTYVTGRYDGKVVRELVFDNQEDPYQLDPVDGWDVDAALLKDLRGELNGWLAKTDDFWLERMPKG